MWCAISYLHNSSYNIVTCLCNPITLCHYRPSLSISMWAEYTYKDVATLSHMPLSHQRGSRSSFSVSEPVFNFSPRFVHTAQSPTGAASWRHRLRSWFSPQRRQVDDRVAFNHTNSITTSQHLYFSPECCGSLFINVFQRHLPTAAVWHHNAVMNVSLV